jgi:hypothetical protein
MDELDRQIEMKKTRNKLKVAVCSICESDNNIYVCEQGHTNLFCKDCLKATKIIRTSDSTHSIVFVAKCTPKGNCNYHPLIPKGVDGIASDPYE